MIYERDKNGRVIGESFDIRLQRELALCESRNGCLIWKGAAAGSGGYPVIRDANNKPTRVSRIMLELDGQLRPSDKHLACHKCDEPKCVNVDHLFWGTPKENTQDASKKGRLNKPSSEHIERIKEANRKRWSSEEARRKHSEIMSDYNQLTTKRTCKICEVEFKEYYGDFKVLNSKMEWVCHECMFKDDMS